MCRVDILGTHIVSAWYSSENRVWQVAATNFSWLQQAPTKPTKPQIEDHTVCGSYPPKCFNNLVTQFIGMIANGDEDMADVLEDWEHVVDNEPILDFNLDEYD